jgi:hypothetical protein
MYAMLDSHGMGIASQSHTVFIIPDWVKPWQVKALLGWLNSSFVKNELIRVRAKLLANGGLGAYPVSFALARMPKELMCKQFGAFITKNEVSLSKRPQRLDVEIEKLCKQPKSASRFEKAK